MSAMPRQADWISIFRAELFMITRFTRRVMFKGIFFALLIIAVVAFDAPLPSFQFRDMPDGGTRFSFEWTSPELFNLPDVPGLLGFIVSYAFLGFYAIAWAFIVWHELAPRRRAFYWAMPVSRAKLHLARVAAGASFLLSWCAGTTVLVALCLLITGRADTIRWLPGAAWVSMITSPLIIYLLLTGILVLANRPRFALFSVVGGFILVYALSSAIGLSPLVALCDGIVNGPASYSIAFTGPLISVLSDLDPGNWGVATALWLTIGSLATLVCARIRREPGGA